MIPVRLEVHALGLRPTEFFEQRKLHWLRHARPVENGLNGREGVNLLRGRAHGDQTST